MSGEPSCYWPNSYPFNNQRTKGPRYFTASENTTLKLSGWNFFCANDFPWKSSSKFSVHFFPVAFGADKLEAKKLRGPRTARILFISCYFKAIDAHFKLQSHLGYQQKKSSPHSFFVLVNPNHPAIGSFHFEWYLHMSARRNTQAIARQAAFRNRLFLGLPLKAEGNPLV